jgi:hypothetical protein
MFSIPQLTNAHPAIKKLMDERHTPSPIMREFALMAALKGMRQKDLAAKVRVTASNLIDHFKKQHPHESTITTYANALGMTEHHVAVARGSWAMSTSDVEQWAGRIQADLDMLQDELLPGTAEKLKAALAQRDKISDRALDEYVLAECRGVSIHGDAGLPSDWPPGIKALAVALRHRFDLTKQLCKQPSGGGLLTFLWLNLRHHLLEEADRDAIIGIVKAMLRGRGADVAPMEAELEREKREFYAILHRNEIVDRQKKSAKVVQPLRDRHPKKGRKQR